MQVFISWSKETSLRFAQVLREWLPDVIQQVHPWVSKLDIEKGQQWAAELGEKLDGLTEGLICVTAENQREPWLNFEAGALAKSLGRGRVRPILLGIDPTEVTGPLSQFQSTLATDRDDMFRLVTSLNRGCTNPLDARRLEDSFDRVWKDYLDKVKKVETDALAAPQASESRSAEDMTREVLELVRDVWRLGVANYSPRSTRPSRRRRPDPSPDVYINGMAFDRSAFHHEFGHGLVLKMLPDLPAAAGAAYVLVDFNDHGLHVVLFDDLVLQHGFLFGEPEPVAK
jgi:TIR domain-containing protein